jgi:hypothetical protein
VTDVTLHATGQLPRVSHDATGQQLARGVIDHVETHASRPQNLTHDSELYYYQLLFPLAQLMAPKTKGTLIPQMPDSY